MKFSGIQLRNFLAHRHLDLALSPLSLVVGPNGAGKSSVGDAVAFGLMAELRRVATKGERKALITDGADKGSITLQIGDAAVTRDVGTGKMTTTSAVPVPDSAAKEAIPCLLDATKFAGMTADERRELLFKVMRVAATPEALLALLVERKHPEHVLKPLRAAMAAGTAAWITLAERQATEARGAWKAITGEAYGDKKAETWTAKAPDMVDADELSRASERLAELPNDIANLQRLLGAIEGKQRAAQEQSERAATLRRKVATLPNLREELERAAVRMTQAHEAVEAAERQKADVDHRTAENYLSCPHCRGSVVLGKGGSTLLPYALPERVATKTEQDTATDDLAEARISFRRAEEAHRAAVQVVTDAEAAEQALATIEEVPDGEVSSQRAALDHELSEAQAEQTELQQRVAKLRGDQQAIDRAAEVTKKAAEHHQAVKEWTALAAALAPDGIPGELLAKALDPINATLRDQAAATRWPQVVIAADMTITAGGRPYGLLSESERWRADVALAVALAIHSELRFVILDRFDVLDVPSRRPALVWLHQVTQSGALDTALVLGTLKEPPKVPSVVSVHWLGEATAEPAKAAA
ncbi:AAA family ATPase [Azospirillum sp.]|uniref:AAA family ATPase n=1 Tax=Azospirillum sp. TaxID=34012 RepID=UPI003D74BD98